MKLKFMAVFVFISQLAWASPHPYIVGGTRVSAQDWVGHSVAALVASSSSGQALCTVSVVAQDLAVTAAHCISGQLTLVFATDIKAADPAHLRQVDKVEIPAEWNHTAGGKDTADVALLHFKGGLPSGYSPSDLLPFDHALKVGEAVELAGYGITNAVTDAGAGILRRTRVTIANPGYSRSEVELDQSHGGGACHGDSGGPAYLVINSHPYLFGITSRGSGNCDREVIYTRIAAYQEWFTRAVKTIRQ